MQCESNGMIFECFSEHILKIKKKHKNCVEFTMKRPCSTKGLNVTVRHKSLSLRRKDYFYTACVLEKTWPHTVNFDASLRSGV